MKPSEEIISIMRDLVKKDTKEQNPYLGWESLDDISQIKMVTECEGYLLRAILEYLDKKHESI